MTCAVISGLAHVLSSLGHSFRRSLLTWITWENPNEWRKTVDIYHSNLDCSITWSLEKWWYKVSVVVCKHTTHVPTRTDTTRNSSRETLQMLHLRIRWVWLIHPVCVVCISARVSVEWQPRFTEKNYHLWQEWQFWHLNLSRSLTSLHLTKTIFEPHVQLLVLANNLEVIYTFCQHNRTNFIKHRKFHRHLHFFTHFSALYLHFPCFITFI